MQVNTQTQVQQPNINCNQCGSTVAAQPCNTQCCATNPQVQSAAQYPANYIPVQTAGYPVYQPTVTQSAGSQSPSASGVTIQIFNPSVGTPGAAPVYNVNQPCYPQNYYTGNFNPNDKGANGSQSGNNGVNSGNSADNANSNSNNTTNTNNTTTTKTEESKKTEKRKIVELNDDYIRNLETYLNSQDKEVRLNAAKQVYDRLQEDDSRYDDKALNALINKMLQDPSQEIRFLALTALDGGLVSGNDYTVGVLKNMQANNTGQLGSEAVDANNILLKMSARQVEKEFEVKGDNKKKTAEMSDRFKPEGTKL